MTLVRILALFSMGLLAACGAKERVILLPDEDGGDPGAIALITTADEEVVLWTTPYGESQFENGTPGLTREVQARSLLQKFGPLLAALPTRPKSFLLYFATGTTTLVSASEPVLELLFEEVSARPGTDVQVTGHTDRVGSLEENDRLSFERAEEISRHLIDRGLDAGLVRAVGRGERDLLVPTDDEVPEQRNRRVEVTIR